MLTDKQITDLIDPYMWVDGSVGARDHMVIARKIEYLVQQEKDAEIKSLCAKVDELEAMTEGQREVITDLEDRLEKAQAGQTKCEGCNGHGMVGNILDSEACPFCKGSGLQSSQPQVSDELKNIRSVKVQGDFAVLVEFPSCRSASAFARALQSIPADTKGGE